MNAPIVFSFSSSGKYRIETSLRESTTSFSAGERLAVRASPRYTEALVITDFRICGWSSSRARRSSPGNWVGNGGVVAPKYKTSFSSKYIAPVSKPSRLVALSMAICRTSANSKEDASELLTLSKVDNCRAGICCVSSSTSLDCPIARLPYIPCYTNISRTPAI